MIPSQTLMSENISTLFLRLEGPMQSWGGRSIGRIRRTESVPTKSGVIGLLGAALGLSRQQLNSRLKQLNQLRMAVRVDREGHVDKDYQTVGAKVGVLTADGEIKKTAATREFETIISPREFIVDASFLVILQGDDKLIDELSAALQHPKWPLFLGRKRCVPGSRVFAGVSRVLSLRDAILQGAPDDDSMVPPDDVATVRVVIDLIGLDEFGILIDAVVDSVDQVYHESKSFVTDGLIQLDPPVHGGRIVLDFKIGRPATTVEPPNLSAPLFGKPGPLGRLMRANDPNARKRAREKALNRCVFCRFESDDPKKLHAHHRTYIRKSREQVSDDIASINGDDLVMLCEECHAAVTMLEYQNGFGLTRIDPVNPAWRSRIQDAREARRQQQNPTSPAVHPSAAASSNLVSNRSLLTESIIPLKAGQQFPLDAPGNRWLANRHHVHQRLSMAFPQPGANYAAAGYGVTRDEGGFLFKIVDGPIAQIIVHSRLSPDWGRAFQNAGWLTDRIPTPHLFDVSRFVEGLEVPFNLEANPIKRLAADGPDGRKGARVALRDDTALSDWMARHAASGGFEIIHDTLVIERVGRKVAVLKGAANRSWDAVNFRGRLKITNAEAFAVVITKGIGSAKGFGFGLLNLARV